MVTCKYNRVTWESLLASIMNSEGFKQHKNWDLFWYQTQYLMYHKLGYSIISYVTINFRSTGLGGKEVKGDHLKV